MCRPQRHRETLTSLKQWLASELAAIRQNQENTVAALDNLKTADAALKAEVTQFLADISAKLSAEDPDIQAVADEINSEVSTLQSNDPNAPAPAPAPAPTPPAGP